MLYKEHLIEIYVNGEKLELENQRSINLRMNNTLFNPVRISSSQAEYSFSFKIPSTPKNDRILNYANNLSRLDKFHVKYNAEVYADGHEIFHGTLTVKSYSEKTYNCNLVQIKLQNIEDIFGDSVMTDIPWYIPFDGASTINEMNEDSTSTVTFPLVSYGAFQKNPWTSDEVGGEYTSKFVLDKYNKWWVESFYPSLNMLETVKRAFKWKGYDVQGSAFNDSTLTEIFMSPNLAGEQTPVYNLGNPRFGKLQLTATMSTHGNGYEQDLTFPYFYVDTFRAQFGGNTGVPDDAEKAWNWESVRIYDILRSGSVNLSSDSYMYDPNEKLIVIPADGFYKIDLQVTTNLNSVSNLTVMQNIINNLGVGYHLDKYDVSITPNLLESTPIEIQLVRNYEDNIELIKGKNNKEYVIGDPTKTVYFSGINNVIEWETCYPHENYYKSWRPTVGDDLGGGSTGSWSWRTGSATTTGNGRDGLMYGYVQKNGEIMAYDQAVSEAFICGFSSFLGGTGSVMKNGYSWSKSSTVSNEAFYKNSGYLKRYIPTGTTDTTIISEPSKYNENTYDDSPSMSLSVDGRTLNGRLSCMVYLKKNDVLELFAVQRAYYNTNDQTVSYSTSNNVQLTIEAASPNSYSFLKYQGYGYNSPSQFDTELKVTNFLNEEQKISEFINGVQKAFNLSIKQDGSNIWINTMKNPMAFNTYAVEMDNRVNSFEAESSVIDYPKSMAVQYKIDEDEWGFEKSVEPPSMLNQPDWKDYADRGYSVIELNDDSYVTETSDISIPFSYTWYDNFQWKEVDQDDVEGSLEQTLRIPVLSKFTYMIDGYDYDESMKHDGYSLTQRFWFRPHYTTAYVWLDSKPTERIQVYIPENSLDGVNLSYKTTEESLLKYFNVTPYLASNYVEIEAYLSPEEYNDLKNGAMVHFDKDLYLVSEISGYDPTNYNTTKIKMIKKIN